MRNRSRSRSRVGGPPHPRDPFTLADNVGFVSVA